MDLNNIDIYLCYRFIVVSGSLLLHIYNYFQLQISGLVGFSTSRFVLFLLRCTFSALRLKLKKQYCITMCLNIL